MRLRARKSAQRFSGEQFEKKWLCEMEKLVDLQVKRNERTAFTLGEYLILVLPGST
ncbi:hypothetical protein TESG_04279 [Trichophyton tonsurans CBS 112818]|uniref:Uncharacterized protein n=1 Tax=Trichophyton tonsurans (strain CBS 112818) TaxID=647933 RepID=F2RZQ2_TRIT1|nr:hypothetical protein TESG_04279 [Trichophyton tonsurans CBS 112818]